jgi:hypothetical protein
MDKLKQLLESKNNQSNVSGNWFSIQWTPDLYTNEKLNIGVGFVDSTGEISVQLLDYYERISCLYGNENMIFQLEVACNISRELILKSGLKNKNITPQITCEINGFAQGNSVEEVLTQLYKTVVPLGRKIKKRSVANFQPRSREMVYNSIKEQLKMNLALDYSRYVPENPFVNVQSRDNSHSIYLPYRSDSGVGTLTSAFYSDKQRVKCNLHDGFWDLDVHAQGDITKQDSIFILLPDESLKESSKISIENEIDKFTWFMQSHQIHVGSHVDPSSLADEISEWCLKSA